MTGWLAISGSSVHEGLSQVVPEAQKTCYRQMPIPYPDRYDNKSYLRILV